MYYWINIRKNTARKLFIQSYQFTLVFVFVINTFLPALNKGPLYFGHQGINFPEASIGTDI